jgi:hypothetical protein
MFFHRYACALIAQAFVFIIALSAASWAAPPLAKSPANVWYTQIGQWHIRQKDSTDNPKTASTEKSFLFHDSRIDGARSGLATANVRINFEFKSIHKFDARISLGPAPATAGLLVQNKQVTYYFLVQRKAASDSLGIYCYRDNHMISLYRLATGASDTTRLTLTAREDSLWCGVDSIRLSFPRPQDFPASAYVGFECPLGSVKVFDVSIESQNAFVKESFDKATLVNLHLDKMLLHGGK